MTYCTQIISSIREALGKEGFDSVSVHFLPDGKRMLVNDNGQLYEIVVKPLNIAGDPMLLKGEAAS